MSAIRLVPNASLDDVVRDAEARYIAANPKSQERFETARKSMPGGNTRTVLHYAPFPLTLAGGEGCRVTDIDGHTYVDFLGEYSAGLYGHSHPRIKAALEKTIAGGLTLGGPNMLEAELASLMCARFPSLERVRFCNSGTEANLYAISAARMATGRSAVMVESRHTPRAAHRAVRPHPDRFKSPGAVTCSCRGVPAGERSDSDRGDGFGSSPRGRGCAVPDDDRSGPHRQLRWPDVLAGDR